MTEQDTLNLCLSCGQDYGRFRASRAYGHGWCPSCYSRWTRAGKPRALDGKPEMPERRRCEICGNFIKPNNKTGICRTNPSCKREYEQKLYKIIGEDFVYALFFDSVNLLKIGKSRRSNSGHPNRTARNSLMKWGIKCEESLLIWKVKGGLQEESYMQAVLSFEIKPVFFGRATRMSEWFETGELSTEDLIMMLEDWHNKMPLKRWSE